MAGCHTIDMVGVYIYDADAVDVVWDPTKETGEPSSTIWVNYMPTNPTAGAWGRGECPPA